VLQLFRQLGYLKFHEWTVKSMRDLPSSSTRTKSPISAIFRSRFPVWYGAITLRFSTLPRSRSCVRIGSMARHCTVNTLGCNLHHVNREVRCKTLRAQEVYNPNIGNEPLFYVNFERVVVWLIHCPQDNLRVGLWRYGPRGLTGPLISEIRY
jgi:hypothetical protein